MRSIWIFILISIIVNIVGTIGKTKQKKKSIPASLKKIDKDHKNMMPEVKDNYSIISQNVDYGEEKSSSYDDGLTFPMAIETEEETKEEFDVKLSELQHTIVMTEILAKPLALRK